MKRDLYSELRTIYETSEADPHTFRLTMKMKDLIDGKILRFAVDQTMKRYPYFCVRVAEENGRICFEDNPAPLPVIRTNQRTVLGSEETSGHLMAFCYWKNRLYIDAHHGLTDGGGIAPLIRTLLYYYCSTFYGKELSTEGVRLADSTPDPREWEDPARIKLSEEKQGLVTKWQSPAFQIGTGGIAHLIPESYVFNLRIPEQEFMRFNLSNDGSPATITALLLARTIHALHPEAAEPPVIAMCVNQRKALKAPFAHQSLVGDVRLPYVERMRKMPFSEQATCFRGMVTLQADDDMVLDEIRDYQKLMEHLETLHTTEEKQAVCRKRMADLSACLTATVSYVGKADVGGAEPYIQEYEALPSTALPSTHVPLTIEMTAVNGYFFLNFIQYFQEYDYFRMFVKQIRDNNINYDVLNVTEARYPSVCLGIGGDEQ